VPVNPILELSYRVAPLLTAEIFIKGISGILEEQAKMRTRAILTNIRHKALLVGDDPSLVVPNVASVKTALDWMAPITTADCGAKLCFANL
jgi:hypothetical protein